MKYLDDAAVDKIVADDPALQDAVQGRRLLLWGPGYGAWVSAQACMSFGSLCSIVAWTFLQPLDVQRFWHMMAFGVLPTGAILIGLSQTVLRGFAFGRRAIYRLTQLLSVAALGVSTACLVLREGSRGSFALGLSAAGSVLCISAMVLVAGPGYALASAFFRARRAFGLRGARSAQELSSRSGKTATRG